MNRNLKKMFGFIRARTPPAMAMALTLFVSQVMAADKEEINVASSSINWLAAGQTVLACITTPIAIGIGIALSVWLLMSSLRYFRIELSFRENASPSRSEPRRKP